MSTLTPEELLRNITQQTKLALEKQEIVFPSKYHHLFCTFAKDAAVDIGVEAIHSSESLDENVMQHAITLGHSANKAVDAIRTQNTLQLAEVLEETQKLREEISKLKDLIYLDALTKTFNRKWLNDHFFNTDGTQFVKNGIVALVDMNDFKMINDRFGHLNGDKVLVYVASQLRHTGGHVVRYGGDEFLVLFEGSHNTAHAHHALERQRQTVLKRRLQVQGDAFTASFAYGLCTFHEGENVAIVFNAADKLMYEDKSKLKRKLA